MTDDRASGWRLAAQITPSPRQLRHAELEFYGFVHYGMNTFTNREWGDGHDAPSVFAHVAPDTRQWARALRSAGMRGAILTCKHHDGFCLWQSRWTDYSVAAVAPDMDIVRDFAAACRAEGLKFGVYLSPWDRHEATYGQGAVYDDYYVRQLTELLTGYGEVFAVWLDGACGEGPNGRRQRYDWRRYEDAVRRNQPNACTCVCGPDVRWCGNEAGQTRPEEWSVVPVRLADAERVQAISQQADDSAFRERRLSSADVDLGSREAIEGERELIWYPAEVNVSIRPGWFYHPTERPREPEELFRIYVGAVGGNASFLLNVPPAPDGRIDPDDERVLAALGERILREFSVPLCAAEAARGMELALDTGGARPLRWLVLREDERFGQRVEAAEALLEADGELLATIPFTTVGHRRMVLLRDIVAERVRVHVVSARAEPVWRDVTVYATPEEE